MASYATRERRARRSCARRGLALRRNARRDPDAIDFGRIRVVVPSTGEVATGTPPEGFCDLSAVEAWLIATSKKAAEMERAAWAA